MAAEIEVKLVRVGDVGVDRGPSRDVPTSPHLHVCGSDLKPTRQVYIKNVQAHKLTPTLYYFQPEVLLKQAFSTDLTVLVPSLF